MPERSSPPPTLPPSGAGGTGPVVSFQDPPERHEHDRASSPSICSTTDAGSMASSLGLHPNHHHHAHRRDRSVVVQQQQQHRRRGTTLSSRATSGYWTEKEEKEDEEDDEEGEDGLGNCSDVDEEPDSGGDGALQPRGSSAQSSGSLLLLNPDRALALPPSMPPSSVPTVPAAAVQVQPPALPPLRHAHSYTPPSSSSSSSSPATHADSSNINSTVRPPLLRPLARSFSHGSGNNRAARPGSPLLQLQSPSGAGHRRLPTRHSRHYHVRESGGGGEGSWGRPLSSSSFSSFKSPAGGTRLVTEHGTYQLGAEIGRGAFGAVFQALNMDTGDVIAVKRLDLTADLASVGQEMELLKKLQHPNIVRYVDCAVRAEEGKTGPPHHVVLHILLEYMENGSLAGVCRRFGPLPEPLVAVYVVQALRGLQYLHEQGVLHRDIKGANILTSKDGTVKLADFGVALKVKSNGATASSSSILPRFAAGSSSSATAAEAEGGRVGNGGVEGLAAAVEAGAVGRKAGDGEVEEDVVVGSPYWMAPEVIEMQHASTSACDIWSLGATVVELLTGQPPYFDLAPMAALFRIVQDEHPPLPEGISDSLRDFLLSCFQKDPSLRRSAAELLAHPWLQQHPRAQSRGLKQEPPSCSFAVPSSSATPSGETVIDIAAAADRPSLIQAEGQQDAEGRRAQEKVGRRRRGEERRGGWAWRAWFSIRGGSRGADGGSSGARGHYRRNESSLGGLFRRSSFANGSNGGGLKDAI